jgi:hypothetical protein
MHYLFRSHLFLDVMSACGYMGRSTKFECFVSNERSGAPFTGTLTLTTVDLLTGATATWASLPVAAGPGPGALAWVAPNATLPNATTTLLVASLVETSSSSVFDEHIVHITAPMNLVVDTTANVSALVAPAPNPDGSVNITVTADAVALFVTLTCAAPGRFSDNAFLLLPAAPNQLQWLPFVADGNSTADRDLLASTLRVEHHATYSSMSPS